MQAWSFQGFKFRSRDSITVLVSPSFVLEKTHLYCMSAHLQIKITSIHRLLSLNKMPE